MCVNYREMNAQTKTDLISFPRIDQVWPILSGAKYFAFHDLLFGYYQLEINLFDRVKIAFFTHQNVYAYTMMPFGFCNVLVMFLRL